MQDMSVGGVAAPAPCQVIAFPPSRRTAKVRRTARAIFAQPSVDRGDRIRHYVAAALFLELERLGLDDTAQEESVGAFFHEVELELYLLEDEVEAALAHE